MHIFKRQEVISQLLDLLDIPRLVFRYSTYDGIGPTDPDFNDKYDDRRKERENIAKDSLENATDEELWELSETPGALSSFELTHLLFDPPPWYAAGFAVEHHKADFSHWVKMDFWTLEEATCLSIGFTPEAIPVSESGIRSPYEALNFYNDRIELFRRINFRDRSSPDQIEPFEFVQWARKKGIEIPSELDQAFDENPQTKLPAMLGTVDARQYDSALKAILGLISNEYGYRDGKVEPDIKKATMSGLADLGLNIDRKTLNRLFDEATNAAGRFRLAQQKRDE